MKHGAILFGVQCLLNFVGTVNLIATSQFNYAWTITTDIIIAILGYLQIKKIAEKGDGLWKLTGFTLGAVAGSILGIFVSTKILG